MSYDTYIGRYRDRLRQALDGVQLSQVARFVEALEAARVAQRTVFLLGNGGSAATASHIACDLNKGVSQHKDVPFRALCVNDSLPTLTAWANDVSYGEVFAGQLKNFLSPGDLLVAISGSGNSPNVIRAVEWAKAHGATVVGLCGYDGGRLKPLADVPIHVKIDDMQVAEDLHLVICHMAIQALCGGVPVCSVPRSTPAP